MMSQIDQNDQEIKGFTQTLQVVPCNLANH